MDVDLDVVLAAIADPTRRTLLQRLAYGAATTGQLAELLPMSRPAVSQHIKILQDAGLIHTAVRGRHRWHELAPDRLGVVDRWTAGLAARHAGMHAQEEPS
ncbi:metalloregulator ArsR/SmtB family transcription factor [Dactylosporangium sp. NBC_01737]|uniref:ArsR/SmtB family transcription factor n=1 Tax=Dactylosporangium sp. NBC_01737 TaxID=2975959 RepID=UPI002E0EF120|nr:metalloregulator ArsR/SmtB family transcription factor [Dactylosporangium sp. NBC_01737]